MDNLQFSQIISETKSDKKFALKYLIKLFNYYNDNLTLPVNCSNPLTAIRCFAPLPTRLLLSEIYQNEHKIIKNNNEYQFHGKPGNRVVFADKILPFKYNDENQLSNLPIPFSFPLYENNEIEILLSNVFYYELTVCQTVNIQNNNWDNTSGWFNECISIGFANKNTPFKTHIGWCGDSFGYHSDDGTVRYNNSDASAIKISLSWQPGDTAGAGIIYVGANKIKPFFTLNGKLVYQYNNPIDISNPIFPAIGYDHSHSIKLNFSTEKFKFKLKKFIQSNSDIVISTKNSFIENYDIGNHLNDLPTNHNNNWMDVGPVFNNVDDDNDVDDDGINNNNNNINNNNNNINNNNNNNNINNNNENNDDDDEQNNNNNVWSTTSFSWSTTNNFTGFNSNNPNYIINFNDLLSEWENITNIMSLPVLPSNNLNFNIPISQLNIPSLISTPINTNTNTNTNFHIQYLLDPLLLNIGSQINTSNLGNQPTGSTGSTGSDESASSTDSDNTPTTSPSPNQN